MLPLKPLILSLAAGLFATSISVRDTLSADALWSADTVKVSGDVTVADSVTLTIAPGTEVVFQGHYRLIVKGRLLANGTAQDSTVFTAADTAAGWHGIRFLSPAAHNDSSILSYCRLEYGRADSVYYDEMNSGGDGGAIVLYTFSKLRLSNCAILRNRALYGGGAVCCNQSSPNLIDNDISNNSAGGGGGGIYCNTSSPRIINNRITRNRCGENGGGIYCGYTASALISGNTITLNRATGDGGGVSCYLSSPVLINNNISGNRAGYVGGGVSLNINASATLIGNLVARDSAGYQGGGIYLRQSYPKINNNTICFNGAGYQGPAIYFYYASPTIYNNIFWANNSYYDTFDSKPVFNNSNYGNPLFSDTLNDDFSLSPSSPCINAGADTAGLGLPALDLAGNPRVAGVRVDLGAFEFQGGAHISGRPAARSSSLSLHLPNPFYPGAKIRFTLPQSGWVSLSVYDMAGKKMVDLVNASLAAGKNTANLGGSRMAPGIYLCRLKSGRFVQTKKLVVGN